VGVCTPIVVQWSSSYDHFHCIGTDGNNTVGGILSTVWIHCSYAHGFCNRLK